MYLLVGWVTLLAAGAALGLCLQASLRRDRAREHLHFQTVRLRARLLFSQQRNAIAREVMLSAGVLLRGLATAKLSADLDPATLELFHDFKRTIVRVDAELDVITAAEVRERKASAEAEEEEQ